jgi:hypothetical protein
MAKNPLFSTYRQGENRVTSSMLAVFERIDLSLLETILASAAGESSLAMVTFANQPPGKGHSIPDARISARFAYWFEVKTVRNTLRAHQLSEHLANLGTEGDERLFVIQGRAREPAASRRLRPRDHRGPHQLHRPLPGHQSRHARRPGGARPIRGSRDPARRLHRARGAASHPRAGPDHRDCRTPFRRAGLGPPRPRA